MYGLIHKQIFDSTLVADGGWLPTYIFMSMVSLADEDNCVKIAPKALWARLGFFDSQFDSDPVYEMFEKAIAYLEQPDPESHHKDYDGRRIIPLSECDWIEGNRGWWIVNRDKYIDEASKERKKEKDRKRAAEKRNKINDVATCRNVSQKVAHIDIDIDIDKDINKGKKKGRNFVPPSLSDVQEFCRERGNSVDPQAFLDHYEANGWYRGKTKIKDWKACVRTWEKNSVKSDNKFEGAI